MARHKWLRRTLGIGLLAGAAYAVWRAIEANRIPGESEWEPQPFPFPPQPRADRAAERGDRAELASERTAAERASRSAESERDRWVTPDVGGAWPAAQPGKAKG